MQSCTVRLLFQAWQTGRRWPVPSVQSPLRPVRRQHRSLCFLQLHMFCSGMDLPASRTTALICCSLSAELEAAHLCNGGPGGKQAEVAGLVLAVMAERCRGMASRSAQEHLLLLAAGASWQLQQSSILAHLAVRHTCYCWCSSVWEEVQFCKHSRGPAVMPARSPQSRMSE